MNNLMSHGILKWDVEELQQAMHLNIDDVNAYFTDGRRISFIVERRLQEILGGQLTSSEGDDHDLSDAQGKGWEVRSITKSGIYFCPSYMVGSGRHFVCDGFLRKLDTVHGYVVSDITQFPKIPYWLIETTLIRQWWDHGKLTSTTKIPRWRALELLQSISPFAGKKGSVV